MTQKRLYDSLQSNIHLLSDKEDIERTLERFKLLHDKGETEREKDTERERERQRDRERRNTCI